MPQRISRNSAHKNRKQAALGGLFSANGRTCACRLLPEREKFRSSELFRSSRVRTQCGTTASFEAIRFKRLN